VQIGNTIFRKENRRDKLTHRFSKHKVLEDNVLTITTTKPQKIHKEKTHCRGRSKQFRNNTLGGERTFGSYRNGDGKGDTNVPKLYPHRKVARI